MQTDGNFVVYNGTTALWNSRTFANPGAKLNFNADGTLNITSTAGKILWAAPATAGGITLNLRNDGNLVLLNSAGAILWQTLTTNAACVNNAVPPPPPTQLPAPTTTTGPIPQPVNTPASPDRVNIRDFGAVGDNTTDDSTAINNAYLAAAASGRPLYIPAGTYYVGTNALIFSLNQIRYTGLIIHGDGVGRSIINAGNVKTSPQVWFVCTLTPCDQVFLNVKDVGFYTTTNGVGVQFGQETFKDPINEPTIDIMVLNFDKTSTAVAVEMNFVLNGNIRLVANTAANGTSLLLRQAKFNHFTGSYGGPGGISVKLTAGFNGGNVFNALDMENVATCVVSDSPSNQANTFIGGTWNYSKNGVLSTAGKRLMIINPEVNPSPPGTVLGFAGASTGLVVTPTPL